MVIASGGRPLRRTTGTSLASQTIKGRSSAKPSFRKASIRIAGVSSPRNSETSGSATSMVATNRSSAVTRWPRLAAKATAEVNTRSALSLNRRDEPGITARSARVLSRFDAGPPCIARKTSAAVAARTLVATASSDKTQAARLSKSSSDQPPLIGTITGSYGCTTSHGLPGWLNQVLQTSTRLLKIGGGFSEDSKLVPQTSLLVAITVFGGAQ